MPTPSMSWANPRISAVPDRIPVAGGDAAVVADPAAGQRQEQYPAMGGSCTMRLPLVAGATSTEKLSGRAVRAMPRTARPDRLPPVSSPGGSSAASSSVASLRRCS